MKRRAFLLLCSLFFTDAALAQTTRTPLSQAVTVSLLGVLSLNLATTGTPTVFIEAWCN